MSRSKQQCPCCHRLLFFRDIVTWQKRLRMYQNNHANDSYAVVWHLRLVSRTVFPRIFTAIIHLTDTEFCCYVFLTCRVNETAAQLRTSTGFSALTSNAFKIATCEHVFSMCVCWNITHVRQLHSVCLWTVAQSDAYACTDSVVNL